MMETFLCFESEGAFFLIPLKLVRHIVQGNAGQEKTITFNGCEAEIYSVGASWGDNREREYAVLLEVEDGLPALWLTVWPAYLKSRTTEYLSFLRM